MMALRQETARLLIADDVGIGKTIEAGLILREYIDRGEIDRFSILCPPHLVDQWTTELETKFSITATPVTASAAARLERDLPNTISVFEAYPFTVVSLDFIKSERRLDDFLRACPEMVVVDEAHAAVSGGKARHRRFDLLRKLADDKTRHLLLLTATPHSGDDDAFHNLLGLLDPEFSRLRDTTGDQYRALRERLAGYYIQRRRRDIDAWREPGLFPQREVSEIKYRLSGDYERFYGAILDYCAEAIASEEGALRQRLAFWGTLSLMRCVGSSPAAASRALRTRAILDADEAEADLIAARAIDEEESAEDDLEPGAAIEDTRLTGLIAQADALAANSARDPKFAVLKSALQGLLKDGYSSVGLSRRLRRSVPPSHPPSRTTPSKSSPAHFHPKIGKPGSRRWVNPRSGFSSRPTVFQKASTSKPTSIPSSTMTCLGTPPGISSAKGASIGSDRSARSSEPF
jgi:hypothetical protein